jgi:hypothetical protein
MSGKAAPIYLGHQILYRRIIKRSLTIDKRNFSRLTLRGGLLKFFHLALAALAVNSTC